MYVLLVAILLISSICLIVLVLMQSGKGSGLSGAFGSAGGGESSLFGANTASVVMKATAVFAAIFMLSCIAVAWKQSHKHKPIKYVEEEESLEPGKTGGVEKAPSGEKDKETGVVQPKESGSETNNAEEGATKNSETGTAKEAEEKPAPDSTGTDEGKKEPVPVESGKQ